MRIQLQPKLQFFFWRRWVAVVVPPSTHYWYWPIITDRYTIPVTCQEKSLGVQTLTTQSGRSVSVQATLYYEVDNPLRVIMDFNDHDEQVDDRGKSAVAAIISDRDDKDLIHLLSEVHTSNDVYESQIAHLLSQRVEKPLSEIGLRLIGALITDFTFDVTTIRHVGTLPASSVE